jgi:CBS domain-containing protein
MVIKAGLSAASIMTQDVICLKADTTVIDAARTLTQAGISGAPITGEDGRLTGLISEEDLVGAFYEDVPGIARKTLGTCVVLGTSLITRRVVTVRPDTPAQEIARAMIIRKIKRVPVVNDAHQVVGIVSRRDILRAMADRAEAGEA